MKEIATYLNFDGNCRQAMEFYKKCLGGELFIMPFSEVPGELPEAAKNAKDRIMHANLRNGSSHLMASDILPGMAYHPGNNFSVSLHCESIQEAESLFTALSEKGAVAMPLQETFWTTRFGMLKDHFGIHWMVNLEKPQQA